MRKTKLKEILDHLHDLFPVPDHNHFEVLPVEEQWRIIGQGEVLSEAVKFYEKDSSKEKK